MSYMCAMSHIRALSHPSAPPLLLDMSDQTPSLQVLATDFRHMSKTLDQLQMQMQSSMGEMVELLRSVATKDEVRSGDAATMAEVASLRGELAVLKGRQSTLEGEQQAGATRIRALEDARTAQRAVTGLVWTLISLLGIGGLAGAARYFLAQ